MRKRKVKRVYLTNGIKIGRALDKANPTNKNNDQDGNQDIGIQTKPLSRNRKDNIETLTINTVDHDLWSFIHKFTSPSKRKNTI